MDRRLEAPTVIGYGGSRGAAKSGGVRRIAMALAYEAPCIIWIIRRVWDDLNKDHVKPLFVEYPALKAYWRAQDRELALPNGSSIFFIHSGDSGRQDLYRSIQWEAVLLEVKQACRISKCGVRVSDANFHR